ncbi:MAG TPA: lipid-A-disaccharide synthase [Candidatus Omnitrophota bacterium]|nr:lipid-A-disaccharide synthase [Candidatus Omnitrophota bacterium]
METAKHLIIVAGEASGDARAAELVAQIRKLEPTATFAGLGGDQMARAGVSLYADLTKIAVVGFTEIIKHLSEIRTLFHLIIKKAEEERPSAVILVDYPGFNLRLATELKKRGIKVIYYISPQVWAWHSQRIDLIKRVVDKMIVFFGFEKDLYAQHGYAVDCVGHPLVDEIKIQKSPHELLAEVGLSQTTTIGLLPGSRVKEVQKIFPVMLQAARYLYARNPSLQFLVVQAPTIQTDILNDHHEISKLPIKIVKGQNYDSINACDLCFVASGTATLETALLLKPMVVVYKTSFLTWALAKCLIKIPYIGLVNVVAGKKIVPECIQFGATPDRLARHAIRLLSDKTKMAKTHNDLQRIKDSLGSPGASTRAAQIILSCL